MKFTVYVRDSSGRLWDEKYDKAVEDPMLWALDTVDKFNASLRPGELPREIVTVHIDDADAPLPHEWRKVSMATRNMGLRSYDAYKCDRCGVTGKRFGLATYIKIDSKFRLKKYQNCGWMVGE